MTCKQLVELLEQFLAGELPVDVRGTLESHLATCANCRCYLASYKSTVRLVADAAKRPEHDPPAEVSEELVRSILSARSRVQS